MATPMVSPGPSQVNGNGPAVGWSMPQSSVQPGNVHQQSLIEEVICHCVWYPELLAACRQYVKPDHFEQTLPTEIAAQIVFSALQLTADAGCNLPTGRSQVELCLSQLLRAPAGNVLQASVQDSTLQDSLELVNYAYDRSTGRFADPKAARQMLLVWLRDRMITRPARRALLSYVDDAPTQLEHVTAEYRMVERALTSQQSMWQDVPWLRDIWDQMDGETPWLIHGVLTSDQSALLVGASQTAKTMLAVCMAVSVATSLSLFGHPEFTVGRAPDETDEDDDEDVVQGHSGRPVLIISCESGARKLKQDIRQVATAYGVPAAQIKYLPLAICTAPTPLGSPTGQAWLHRQVERLRPALVVIDPTNKTLEAGLLAKVNTASAADMVQVFAGITDPLSAKGIATLIVAHTNRPGARKSTVEWLTLEDACGAGYPEHFRNRLLLSKITEWDPEQRQHDLGLETRLSDGFGCRYRIKLTEGDRRQRDTAMTWEITKVPPNTALADLKKDSGSASEDLELADQIAAFLRGNPGEYTQSRLYKQHSAVFDGAGETRIGRALEHLVEARIVTVRQAGKSRYYSAVTTLVPEQPVPANS